MKDLIEALTIFLKYADKKHPTNCSHDTLWIVGISPFQVSVEDIEHLGRLGFYVDESDDCFKSSRFGSA